MTRFILATVAVMLCAHGASAVTAPGVSNPFVWLDASNVDGQNNATVANGLGMTNVNAFGNTNADWFDGGSQSLGTWVAVGGTRESTFIANAINGLPAVRFDGGDDIVLVDGGLRPSLLNSVSSDATIFAISSHSAAGVGSVISTRSGGTGWTLRQNDADSYRYFLTGTNADVTSNSAPTALSDLHFVSVVRDGDNPAGNAQLTLNVDGADVNTVTGTNGFNPSTAGTAVGNNRQGNAGLAGDIAEVIIFDRVLSDAEQSRVEAYLSIKYQVNTGDKLGLKTLAVDINSGNSPTADGFVGLAPTTTSGNGENVVIDGTEFRIFSSAGHRNRGTANGGNDITGDFIFDDGPNAAVGLQVFDLADGIYMAEVFAFDGPFSAGEQIVGITEFAGGETIFGTFTSNANTPFIFEFDSRDFDNGFGIFTREATNNRSRFNGLRLTQLQAFVPEPTTALLGLMGLAGLASRRRRAA